MALSTAVLDDKTLSLHVGAASSELFLWGRSQPPRFQTPEKLQLSGRSGISSGSY